MDMTTLGAALALVKGLPDSDISRAEEAATRAEAAAAIAEESRYNIQIESNGLVFTKE